MMNRRRAFSLIELMVTLAIASLLLGGVLLSFFGLQRTFSGCGQYAASVTNGNRLIDYLSIDLRRALRVNQGVATAANPLRGGGTRYVITDTNILSITVPDYYASNSQGSTSFRTARYPYPGDPNYAVNGTYGQAPFASATKAFNNKYTTAFVPPATGNDELEIRYVRTTRALHDPAGAPGDQTVCIFRQEYKDGTRVSAISKEEIADQIEAPLTSAGVADLSAVNNLSVTSQNATGTSFLIQFGFTSRLSFAAAWQNASVAGSGASTLVSLRNPRRD